MLFAVDSDTGVVTKFAATGLASTSNLLAASAKAVYLEAYRRSQGKKKP